MSCRGASFSDRMASYDSRRQAAVSRATSSISGSEPNGASRTPGARALGSPAEFPRRRIMSREQDGWQPESGTVRWWIPGPGDDESLRSITERAERLYGGHGDKFRSRLIPRTALSANEASCLDLLPSHEIYLMARAIGVKPKALFPHRLLDEPLLLMESERRAYCPECWIEDRSAGRPPAFRRRWAGLFVLRCEIHGGPLHWCSSHLAPDAVARAPVRQPNTEERQALAFIDAFAFRLEQSLRGLSGWPPGWRGNVYNARALLMRCVVNLGCVLEHPPYANFAMPPELDAFARPPLRRVEPLRDAPWDCVRSMGPPAWRRAALWMVSRYVLRSPARGHLRGGRPPDPFTALEMQWERLPANFQGLRRTRRYRDAIRALCEPFED